MVTINVALQDVLRTDVNRFLTQFEQDGIILLDPHFKVVEVASTTDPTGTSTDVKFTVR
ncbi:hypothetical protein BDM02DRAFT_3119790 [Thelephora ganbajun]|uniref:Uncharacterized protein n=1 Tax=Thelephora ganbajun TaxID=370292 RepID=A0ACB6Z835_THEGA|nr:hypothetical protein BDM02DRAFT_3119790 [Thelephora ganbajun]